MGYMRHHAIVATSWQNAAIEEAHTFARGLGLLVTSITSEATNGYRSFIVAPDGSKEGWPESDRGDKERETFIKYLRSQYHDDGSSAIDWAEVQFGGDVRESKVLTSSSEDYQNKQAKPPLKPRSCLDYKESK